MDRNNLAVGSTITIKRSDGRTHGAVVASIDYNMSCVKVEWFEGGETKGKEIDFINVSLLNPNFIINDEKEEIDCLADAEVSLKEISEQNNKRRQSAQTVNSRIQSAKARLTQANTLNSHMSSSSELLVKGNRMTTTNKTTRSVIENLNSDNTLKKLGKLEKDRIERRKKQAEVKAVKEEFTKKCQNNPHWELIKMIEEYCKKIEFRPLTADDQIEEHLITVAVRKRPLNRRDVSKKEVDIVTIPSKNQLIVHEPKFKVDLTKYLENHTFKFDYTFNETCTNEMVYKYTAHPLIKTVFDGGFATCFAYGQTGSGKTYTMSGNFSETSSEKGIYSFTAADVFRLVNSNEYRSQNFMVSCSFFEIYTKKVYDLLNKKATLKILEDGKQQVQVVGLTEKVVSSVNEVLQLIQKGNDERASGQTSANLNSSRSHAIFQIYLRCKNKSKIHGKFSLIDLAGNERGADTFSSSKITRLEGADINQSLLALKECIRALGRKGAHLPFRACKLTQVLRDSFVGANSKTCMIAMVSPGVSSCENTLNTLRYADRVKELGSGDMNLNKTNAEEEALETSEEIDDAEDSNMSVKESSISDNIAAVKFKADKLVVNSHRDTLSKLKSSLHEAEELLNNQENERYYENWENVLDSTLAYLLSAKECLEEVYKKE